MDADQRLQSREYVSKNRQAERNLEFVPKILIAGGLVLAVGWLVSLAAARLAPAELVTSDVETAIDPAFLPPEEVDRLITVYERRTTEASTPSDFLNLGYLYLEAARIAGHPARFVQAEAAFAQAAELSPQDPSPLVGRARTELALHDFAAAAATGRRVLVDIPTRLDAVAVVADAEMAMGSLEEARGLVAILDAAAGQAPGALVRQAQLAWLEGRLDDYRSSAVEAVPDTDANPRRISWYEAYAANTAFSTGELESARELAASALEHDPNSIAALVVASRIASADGDFASAIAHLEQATATTPNSELSGELGDLYARVGDEEAAAEQFGLADVIGRLAEAQGVFNRQVARFYADHDLEVERAFELASAELEIRRDPLGYDTLAWALYKAGRLDEAVAAIDQALADGFQDAETFYHHGLIALALDDEMVARASLGRALELNPHFDLRGAAHARAVLASLP